MTNDDRLKSLELELKARELQLKELQIAMQLVDLKQKADRAKNVQKVTDAVAAPFKKISNAFQIGKELTSCLLDEALDLYQAKRQPQSQPSTEKKDDNVKTNSSDKSKLPALDLSLVEQNHAKKNWDSVGRNDLCPCGSGKKFKNCHGRIEPSVTEELAPAVLKSVTDSCKDKYEGVGRNDLCPCGSGKKFKHCHGRVV